MLPSRPLRLVVATSALLLAGLFAADAGAEAAPPSSMVSFSTSPSLFPGYAPLIHDYVVRCDNGPVTVQGRASGGWEVSVAGHPYRSGDFVDAVPLSAGHAFTVTVRQAGHPPLYRYYVRCLPNDFPKYTFTRDGPASPLFFTVENVTSPFDHRYAMVFDNHGVPIWWYKAPTHDAKVLPSGNLLWFNFRFSRYEIHRLDGTLVRPLNAVGHTANAHDVQVLGNGDHLVSADVRQRHVDTSAYGGSSDATVINAELQEVSPSGNLVWDWKTQDHISLAETGRWWGYAVDHGAVDNGYDIVHWNSIEPDGDSVIASFKDLDAVYKIDQSTGDIVWKLGGTTTPESLAVKGDPRGYPLGAQHDARLLPDGTLTVFNNRSYLGNRIPRAERFRIDEQAGTATLIQSITDPEVPASNCCGSARRLGNGDWLISWGGLGDLIGGYEPDGQRTFVLKMNSNRTYRAEPVPAGAVSAEDLRAGMNAMYGAP
jgi:hypothetical protein